MQVLQFWQKLASFVAIWFKVAEPNIDTIMSGYSTHFSHVTIRQIVGQLAQMRRD